MKETTVILLCAVALVHGDDISSSHDARTCNCDPSEAQQICKANFDGDNVLIAHEFCDKFYKCSNGKPYPYKCPSNLLYDPVKEVCEWPDLVECGDRPISGSDNDDSGDADCDGENDSESDNDVPPLPPADNDSDIGGNDQGGNDNGGNDQGGGDNGGNDNNGTCNCNPEEAPAICASDDSNGTLIAHENCNQFYICDHGKPVVMTCGPNTFYNPYTEQCDWASEVDCGDRLIPDLDDNESNDNGGNDQGGSDNGGNDQGGSDNGGNDNNGTCNCNPEEAPAICASEDSSGTLIAHENCNQFYICDHGKPVVMTCGPNTFYNPYTEQCDWASEVDCGDRLIPDLDDNGSNDNGGNDQGGSDNGGNNQGGSDNGGNDNNGTCNCNPEEAPAICASDDSSSTLIAHENCNQFYICDHGKPVVMTCGPNTFYNPYTEQCDWASEVDCGDRLIPDLDDNGSNDNGGNDQGGSDNGGNDQGGSDNGGNDQGGSDNGGNDNNGTCNCNPEEAPAICASEDSSGTLIAHENCNQFYICDHGKPVVMTCGPNTFYNPYTEQCDWASEVDCGDRLIPDPNDNGSNDNGENDQGGSDNSGNDQGGDDNGGNDNNGTCNCNPEEAPAICASDDSSGTLIAHENCNQFYICDHGKPVVMTCGPNTFYNPYTEQCDWASEVDCGDRLIPDPNDNGSNDNGENDQGGSDNGGNDQGGDDNGGNDNNGTCNCNPEEAPAICASEDSSGTLIAHENCNQFYICDHGKPVVMTCGPNTFYNPYTEQCDWASEVDCGDRLIPDPNDNGSNDNGGNDHGGSDNGGNDQGGSDNGGNDQGGDDNGGNDNNGTCNCNPEEAPAICASDDSSGTLIAHENCNQFYICDHGKPVVMTCGPNTFYNPYTEQCDWASEVDCGDRLIPDPDDNGSNDNGGNDHGGSDNGGNDQGGDDNGGNDNNGTCNCNPEEAPAICASDDSSGTLIAHENCNQFYICDHGKPVVMTCGPNTFYNPYTEQCDLASEVDCGDRLIPDPDNDNDSGNDSEGDIDDNLGNDNEGDIDDNLGNDSEGDNLGNDSENDDSCNCYPDQAPSICAGENSNGVLIAHKNCNQFYKCSYGTPVEFTCPPSTLYHPYEEECRWANEVECGDRVIPDPNDDNNNDSSDEGDIDDSSSNDTENDGTCNCNPEEAPSICADADSDGVLVAHENCNKFYLCSNGVPVAIKCPSNTLYNPYKGECDWESEVECGDRLIPEPEDDDESSDNDGDDDDNNGHINDGPSQAPAICAESDSTGVLVAHENCNQFYQCTGGLPIAISCAGNLLFNPITKQCDWPRNVDCGDRIIPGNDDDCACNPRNAPALCSRENFDGKFVAHENCNQFYVCVNGLPLPRYCAPSLFYSIEKEQCDWPQNVDCSSRTKVSYSSVNKHMESRQTLKKLIF